MTITFVSIVVALLIGGIEALGLIGDELGCKGPFWAIMDSLNDNFGTIGFVIIGVFVVSWSASLIIYRMKKYDDIEVNTGRQSTNWKMNNHLSLAKLKRSDQRLT